MAARTGRGTRSTGAGARHNGTAKKLADPAASPNRGATGAKKAQSAAKPVESGAASARGKRRRQRGAVSPEDMISAAFDLASEVGLAEMSMPQLARHMGLPVTTIYWHFRTRDNLLNAMLARAMELYHLGNPFIDDAPSWDEALKNHFRKMRVVYLENPLLCDLVLLRAGEFGPDSAHAAVENLERVVKTLVDAGFDPDNALDVYLALSAHSRGSAILEHINATQHLTDRFLQDRLRTTGVTAEVTPLLYELASRGHNVAELNFEFTLDAIIDHAKALLRQDKAKRRSR
jgi:AcrR family transcriptional regulator